MRAKIYILTIFQQSLKVFESFCLDTKSCVLRFQLGFSVYKVNPCILDNLPLLNQFSYPRNQARTLKSGH